MKNTKWIVCCGSASCSPNPRFDNESDAIKRFNAEITIPSYFGAGHKRQASVIKETITYEDVTPHIYAHEIKTEKEDE